LLSEVELGEVAVKVALGTVLLDAGHSALEDREKAFDGVGMRVAAHPFLFAVIARFVTGEAPADRAVHVGLIGSEIAGGIGVIENHLAHFTAVTLSTLTERDLLSRLTRVTIFRLSP
jgi:hypothetical protein